MPALKPGTIWPTPEEGAAITAAAMDDIDTMPLTEEEWEAVKPFVRIGAARPVGRQKVDTNKPKMTMRVDADVLAALRATGKGWQTRINAILREAVETGKM